MTVSLHTASTATFLSQLSNLSHVLKKAEANLIERKIDLDVLTNARLAPDMLPLKAQVMIATDVAKGAVFRLAGQEIPKFEDVESTFPELQARIAKTITLLRSVRADAFVGREGATISLPNRNGPPREFTALDFLFGYALPNFSFHVVTAYAILRHNGVPLGKGDYFGRA